MAKKIKQFRLYTAPKPITDGTGKVVRYDYGDCMNNSPVYPLGDDQETISILTQYESGDIFNKVYPISQLGIQAIPGTKFYLNGSVKPITIGASGIYDLDIKNGARVTGLGFDRTSLENITQSGTGYLIVDILYGEEEAE